MKITLKYIFIIIVSFLFIGGYFGFKHYQRIFFEDVIPKDFELTDVVVINEESGFKEGCGAAIFSLSDSTIKKINLEGLRFFEGATQARGHNESYYTYQNWSKSPIPKNWTSEGTWIHCLRHDLVGKITEAGGMEDSYYTSKNEGELVVIPALGLIIFTFYG